MLRLRERENPAADRCLGHAERARGGYETASTTRAKTTISLRSSIVSSLGTMFSKEGRLRAPCCPGGIAS